ncbi:hypothetical protein Avbf_01578 [Armadillidium vulgare]|nr:hypothetical protein Avbf_01578 [Armadillidium vulgare]
MQRGKILHLYHLTLNLRIVYWIYDNEGIYMKSLKGREEPKIFLQQGLDNPENLAVDWLGRNIYITEYKKSQILVCNLEAKDCFALLKNLSQPRSLQLDLEERQVSMPKIHEGICILHDNNFAQNYKSRFGRQRQQGHCENN